jgi:glycosyltransferase involved in cell wall biosynthesis
VDRWLIVDTGSTDSTRDVIRAAMDGLPGRLLERPWVNFGHNRTEALRAGRQDAEYAFVIDADEVLEVPRGFRWPKLHGDSVMLNVRMGHYTYRRTALVANRLPWVYRGVLHEYLDAPGAGPPQLLDGPVVVVHSDGARGQGLSTTEKYARDARTLEAALVDEPDNARYQYYLARSYLDSGQHDAALAAFRRRTEMVGFVEEAFDSLLEIGRLVERAGADFDDVHRAYLAAWENRPTRAEPLYELARYCRTQNRFAIGRMAAWQAMAIPRPADLLWVLEDVYTWRCHDEYAVAAYWTGAYAECRRVCRQLIDSGKVPPAELDRVRANLSHAQQALAQQATAGPRH